MKKLLVLVLLLSSNVYADLPFQPHFTWSAPTEFTDGSILDPIVDISEYRLRCTGPITLNISVSNTLANWESPVGVFIAGDYICTIAAVATVANGGLEAEASNPVNFTVSQKEPRPVVNFGAT